MEAILDPSKEIKEGYQAYRAVTTGGQIVTGLKVSQNDQEVVLRDATGKEVRIPAKQLEELTPSKKSLMPDDVVTHLKFNEFIDLIAFLRDRQAQEALRGLALEFWVLGPMPANAKEAIAVEKGPSADMGIAIGEKKLAWKSRLADAGGYLDLKSLLGGADTAAYALTHVWSPKEQKVKMGIGGPEVRVWLNGEQVHDERVVDPTEVQREVSLINGWNAVLIRIGWAEGNNPGFALRFVGGEGLRLSLRKDADIAAPK
jgi:hypothetical protein